MSAKSLFRNGRKLGTGLAASVLLAAAASACGTAGSGKVEEKGETAPPDPVELVFVAHNNTMLEDEFKLRFGNKLKEKYPHMTIKYIPYGPDTTIEKLLVANQPIDIVLSTIGLASTLYDGGILSDITPLMKQNKYDDSHLEPSVMEMMRVFGDGQLFGLPVTNNSTSLYYNRDLFDKFAVPYPSDGMTWDETYELAKKMTRNSDGLQYYGFGMSFGHVMLTNQYSLPMINKSNKAAINTDRFKHYLNNFTRFYAIPGYDPKDSNNDPNVLAMFEKQQRVAMFAALSQQGINRYQGNFNWDMVAMPVFADQPNIGPQPYPVFHWIAAQSKHKEDAFKAIAYWASEEHQRFISSEFPLIPVLKDKSALAQVASKLPFAKDKNIKSILPKQFAPSALSSRLESIAASVVSGVFAEVVQGKKDMNTALRDGEERLNAEIAKRLNQP